MNDEVMEPGNSEESPMPAPDDEPTAPDNGEEEVANVVDAPEAGETVVYDSEAEAAAADAPANDDEEPAAE
jgi:hypothetical protein